MTLIFRIVIACLMVSLFFPFQSFASEEMKIVYFFDYKPFSWRDQKGQMQGFLIEAMNEALHKRMGISIKHSGYPWARAQHMVKTGRADAFVTISTPERQSYAIMSTQHIVTEPDTVFTWKNNPDLAKLKSVRSFSDLSAFRHVQYIGNGWAENNFKGMEVRWVPTLNEVLKLLYNEHYDFFADTYLVTKYNIKSLGYHDKIIELPEVVLTSSSYRLGINKNSTFVGILPKFDLILTEMHRDGTIQRLYEKFRNFLD